MADEPDLDAELGPQLIPRLKSIVTGRLPPDLIVRLKSEAGLTMIETAIASGILLVVMAGLLSMAALATTYTENHGHLEARTTEYAQDKMEQLLALAYSDEQADTVFFPANGTGGTGLKIGGGIPPNADVNGYVDWLAYDGTLLHGGTTAPTDWFYKRVWVVECVTGLTCTSSSGVKQITVLATVKSAVGGALIPKSTVVAMKACQF